MTLTGQATSGRTTVKAVPMARVAEVADDEFVALPGGLSRGGIQPDQYIDDGGPLSAGADVSLRPAPVAAVGFTEALTDHVGWIATATRARGTALMPGR